MLISKREIKKLSADIRRIIDGQDIDVRDNREGVFPLLKNDIHTLAQLKNEQIDILQRDHDILRDRLEDISHQLKTPLTSTIIMADLLEDAPPEKQAEFVANIRQSLTRMEWLVSTLLKIAKLDTGVIEFLPETLKADRLIELAVEPLHIQLEIRDQHLEVRGGETELVCDKRWTVEALTNVLKNASEHSPEGGSLLVTCGTDPISAWIAVTDSGKGIAQADIANVFRRFEGSRSSHGYGIGLPLALAIMREQNGDIQIEGGGIRQGSVLRPASASPTSEGVSDHQAGRRTDPCLMGPPGAQEYTGATFTLKFYK